MPRLTGVRELRERAALKQAELADRAGLHRITVLKAEGGRSVGVGVVARIAAALGVAPSELVMPEPCPTGRKASPKRETRWPGLGEQTLLGAVDQILRGLDPDRRVQVELKLGDVVVAAIQMAPRGCECGGIGGGSNRVPWCAPGQANRRSSRTPGEADVESPGSPALLV